MFNIALDDPAHLTFSAILASLPVFQSIRIYFQNKKRLADNNSNRRRLPRLSARECSSALIWQWVLLLFIVLSGLRGRWQPEDIGVTFVLPWYLSFACGAGIYFLLLYAIDFVEMYIVRRDLTNSLENTYLSLRVFIPRKRRSRLESLVAIGFMNPVTEEFLYRGVLVYYLGNQIGCVWIAIVFGLAVCLLVHLYQGVRALPFHAAFFCVSIAILYSPLGLIGAIGFHFIGDILPLVQFRRAFLLYRLTRRCDTNRAIS